MEWNSDADDLRLGSASHVSLALSSGVSKLTSFQWGWVGLSDTPHSNPPSVLGPTELFERDSPGAVAAMMPSAFVLSQGVTSGASSAWPTRPLCSCRTRFLVGSASPSEGARPGPVPSARAEPRRPVAAVTRHYVNLTNGLEALPALSALVPAAELRFTRVQSSHAEASAYDKLLSEVDHDLLWSLASGHTCYLYDFASRNPKRGVSRAQFLGAEFIKWALAYLWFGKDSPLVAQCVLVRNKNLVRFWRDDVLPYKIAKDTKKRIRYYTPFALASGVQYIDLRAVYGRASVIDGRKEVHVDIARKWLDSAHPAATGSEEFDFRSWMDENKLAQFHADTDADELRRIQRWMQDEEGER